MTTPVMALRMNILRKFEGINSAVSALHKELEGEINGDIFVDPDLSKFYGPRFAFSTKTISVSETFLNYLWCFTFFSIAFQEKTNELLSINPDAGFLPNSPGINNDIYRMKDYCQRIAMDGYVEWPEGLPSPDFVGEPTTESEIFIGHANSIFTIAITFMFLHELGHFVCNHQKLAEEERGIKVRMLMDRTYFPDSSELAPIIIAETEADCFALSTVLKDHDSRDLKINVSFGIIVSFCSMFFAVRDIESIGGTFHPSTHERVSRALQTVKDRQVENKDYFYHFAGQIIGLVLDDFDVVLDSYDAGDQVEDYFESVLNQLDQFVQERFTRFGRLN